MKADTPASASLAAVLRGGPIRWLVFGGMLLIAAIAVGATLMAGNFRERALHNAGRELENTVLLLTRHFDQQLEDIQVVQNDLIEHIRASGIATAGSYKSQLSTEATNRMLVSKMSALSYVGGVNLFDNEGRLINSSVAWPTPARRRCPGGPGAAARGGRRSRWSRSGGRPGRSGWRRSG